MGAECHNGCLIHFFPLKHPRNLMYFCWPHVSRTDLPSMNCIRAWHAAGQVQASNGRNQRVGDPGLYYTIIITGDVRIRIPVWNFYFFDHEKGQTSQPAYSCNVILSFFAATLLLLLQGKRPLRKSPQPQSHGFARRAVCPQRFSSIFHTHQRMRF